MQDDINQKSIAVIIKTTKLTARLLKAILRALLRKWSRRHQQKAAGHVKSLGKTSLKKLQSTGQELTNIEITDENIKSFERCARKYGVDFSLKRDRNADPPVYYVFFKAKDVKVMEAAFREYTAKETVRKPSVRKKLKQKSKQVNRQRERTKEKKRDRSESR